MSDVIKFEKPEAIAEVGCIDTGGAMQIAGEIQKFLQTIKDEDTGLDSGGGEGGRDLWVVYKGREYLVNIRPSNAQLTLEGA